MSKYGQGKYQTICYGVQWRGSIFDRTQRDVENKTSKAYLNANDLNRIEDNCAYLLNLFKMPFEPRAEWTLSDYPYLSEMEQLLQDITTIRNAYYTPSSTPDTPINPLNSWQKWNAAEQILNNIYVLYHANQDAYVRAGEAFSGDEIGVI